MSSISSPGSPQGADAREGWFAASNLNPLFRAGSAANLDCSRACPSSHPLNTLLLTAASTAGPSPTATTSCDAAAAHGSGAEGGPAGGSSGDGGACSRRRARPDKLALLCAPGVFGAPDIAALLLPQGSPRLIAPGHPRAAAKAARCILPVLNQAQHCLPPDPDARMAALQLLDLLHDSVAAGPGGGAQLLLGASQAVQEMLGGASRQQVAAALRALPVKARAGLGALAQYLVAARPQAGQPQLVEFALVELAYMVATGGGC
jgi:hypothetical protein